MGAITFRPKVQSKQRGDLGPRLRLAGPPVPQSLGGSERRPTDAGVAREPAEIGDGATVQRLEHCWRG
jgi:hypothetical protein